MHDGARAPLGIRTGVAVALVLLPPCVAARARADEIDGRWSLQLELRGNGFQQRSSRAVVPEAALEATSPDGLELSGSYLVDVISSASVAQGGGGEGVFTELRHAAEVGVARELPLSRASIALRGRASVSVEDDYASGRAVLGQTLALDERNLLLALDVGLSHDRVSSNLDPDFGASLTGLTARGSVERVLSPTLVLALGYELGVLHGFQSNAYRRVLVGPLPYPERHPDTRVRHELSTRLRAAVTATGTVLRVGAAGYLDSWEIAALAPELGLCQPLPLGLLVQLHYRFYAQRSASFFRRTYPAGHTGPVTNDPKMAAMRTHTVGASLELALPWLAQERGGFAREATLDLALERYLSTSAYGDGWLGTAGARVAF